MTFPVSGGMIEHMSWLRRHGFLFTRPKGHVTASKVGDHAALAGVKSWFFTLADSDTDFAGLEEDMG